MGNFSSSIWLYLSLITAWNILIFITPLLSIKGLDNSVLFNLFSVFCHQIFERSLCMNKDMEISSCSIDQGYTYQFPVCARDFAFYFAMLLGGIFILALGKDKDREIPSLIFLFIFVLPTAIDGLTQLFGIRESNNQLRIATGFLAGIIVPFYVIPIMNRVFNKGAYNARKRSRIRS